MSNAKYAAVGRDVSWWRTLLRTRTRKVVASAAALVTVAAAAVAAALFFTAGIQGGVSVGGAPEITWTQTEHPDSAAKPPSVTNRIGNGPDFDCTAEIVDGSSYGDLVVNVTGAWPGDRCDVIAYAAKTGDSGDDEVLIQDITFTENVDVTLVEGCGATVDRRPATRVHFRIEVPTNAEQGEATADTETGLHAVLADEYDPAACPDAG